MANGQRSEGKQQPDSWLNPGLFPALEERDGGGGQELHDFGWSDQRDLEALQPGAFEQQGTRRAGHIGPPGPLNEEIAVRKRFAQSLEVSDLTGKREGHARVVSPPHWKIGLKPGLSSQALSQTQLPPLYQRN